MKKNEIKKLRTKSLEELKKSLPEKRLEISKVLTKIASKQEKNLKKASLLKKDLAQTLTIVKEMEIMNKLEEVSKVEKVSGAKKGSKNHGSERTKGVEG